MSVYPKKRKLLAGIILYALLILILAIIKSGSHNPNSDFGTFWTTGKHFFQGDKLYEAFANGRDFLYPPFAAFCFQLFAALPFRLAAFLMYLLNGLLFPASVFVLYKILRKLQLPERKINMALGLAALFSAKYFWSNLSMFQMNAVVFFLVLLGIYYWITNKHGKAGLCFVLGIFIKVTPIFFLLFLLLDIGWKRVFSGDSVLTAKAQREERGGRKDHRDLVPFALSAANFAPLRLTKQLSIILITLFLCLATPIIQRGWQIGIADLQEYYESFLEPFQEGRVVTTYKNQNLAASIHRMFTETDDELGLDYHWILLDKESVQLIVYAAYALFSLALFAGWWVQSHKLRQPGLYFFAMLLAYTHLMSGISWSAHLVSFLMILVPFFLLEIKHRSLSFRILYYGLWIWIAFAGIVGKDTMGNLMHHYAGGYNLIAGLLAFLFFFYLFLAYEENRRSTHRDSPTPTRDQPETGTTPG